jgi:hypothetical protein
LGGLFSGALGGLAADLAAGGLTLGGGMIVGGILGALGATGVAREVNLAKGEDASTMRWSNDFFERLTVTAILRYLAVAHFGRGRGEWSEGEHPPFWQPIVEQAVAAQSGSIERLQKSAARGEGFPREVELQFASLVELCAKSLLAQLYPAASSTIQRKEEQRAPVEGPGPHLRHLRAAPPLRSASGHNDR